MGIGDGVAGVGGLERGEGIYTVRVGLEFHLYSEGGGRVQLEFQLHLYSIVPSPLSSPPSPAHMYIVEINSDLKGTLYSSPEHKYSLVLLFAYEQK